MKLIGIIMGQDCEEYLKMCIPAIKKHVDSVIFIDGGSKDGSVSYASLMDCEIIHNTYLQDDKDMNGKQRNFYLEHLKTKYKDSWCLVLDADEVVSAENLKQKVFSLDKNKLYSVHMRHFIQDLRHEDATNTKHFVPNRLFFIGEKNDDISYPLGEHVFLQGRPEEKTEVMTIWHLAYAQLFHIRRRFDKNSKHSNIHSLEFLQKWYLLHIFGEYPKREIDPVDIPEEILEYFFIDKDSLYFSGRNIETKHPLMVKQWYDFFKPKRVLDLGCGKGVYLYFWLWFCDAEGIEISPYAVETAFVPKDKIHKGNICDYHIEPDKYDLITCIDVLEHLTDDELEQCLQNICRKSETYLFSIPYKGDPNLLNDRTHKQFRTKEEWIMLLEKCGLKIEDVPVNFMFKEQMLIGRRK